MFLSKLLPCKLRTIISHKHMWTTPSGKNVFKQLIVELIRSITWVIFKYLEKFYDLWNVGRKLDHKDIKKTFQMSKLLLDIPFLFEHNLSQYLSVFWSNMQQVSTSLQISKGAQGIAPSIWTTQQWSYYSNI